MIHVQLKVVSEFNMSIWESLTGIEGPNNFPTSGRFNPQTPMGISPWVRNLGTTLGKEKIFWPWYICTHNLQVRSAVALLIILWAQRVESRG